MRNLNYARYYALAALLLSGSAMSFSPMRGAPAAASPSPAATPPAATATTPAAAAATPPKYDGVQQGQYITTANNAFAARRKEKFQAFIDTRTAFENAGGINSKGLTDKAAVAARRDLLTKVRAAEDDYLSFITIEESIYREELGRTPLAQEDVDSQVSIFATKTNIPRSIKMQQDEKDLLGCSDEMLGDLEKWSGQWSLTASDKLTFKKKSDKAAYTEVEEKYNGIVRELQALQAEAAPSPSPSPAAAPAPGTSVTP